MKDISAIDYSALDRPEVLMFLFHPRPEMEFQSTQTTDSASRETGRKDYLIPVEKDINIGARFHVTEKSGGNLLFFHGNGEIVADYDELGKVYNQMGINLLAVDYRGYGRSDGKPTVTNMMQDCHRIFHFTRNWLEQNNFSGPIIPMGRSLGSASVLELAANYKNLIDGLIIESGFAYAGPLLALLGIDTVSLGFTEERGFRNVDKIKDFDKPTLIIHAEFDHIIPFSDGQALHEACPSGDKQMLKISGANHNDIFMRGMQEYLETVKRFVEFVRRSNP